LLDVSIEQTCILKNIIEHVTKLLKLTTCIFFLQEQVETAGKISTSECGWLWLLLASNIGKMGYKLPSMW
jgi:hypothetical protein